MDQDEFDDIRVAVRRFVREEVLPLEPEIEERDEIPDRIRKAAADMGLFGFALPAEYGGLGLSMEQEAALVFELGYTTPAFRSMFGTNNGIAGHVLMPRASGTPPRWAASRTAGCTSRRCASALPSDWSTRPWRSRPTGFRVASPSPSIS
jgi:acyl-CoA dehydrogenase